MTRKHIGLMLVIILVAITSGLVLTRGQTIDSTATVTRGSTDLTESQVTEHITRLDGTWRFQSSLLDAVDRQSYRKRINRPADRARGQTVNRSNQQHADAAK